MSKITDLIDEQVAAYRDRDVERFINLFADEVSITDFVGNALMNGRDDMRSFYSELFRDSTNLSVEIANRIECGDYVIDEEHIDGIVSADWPTQLVGVTVYRVVDGLIGDMKLIL